MPVNIGRSQELTKNLVHTRHQLENHFKSIKRREADFKKQKLVNVEEELKATSRMARPTEDIKMSRRPAASVSPRDQPRNSSASNTGPLQRSKSSGRPGSGSHGLIRSWSSPEGWPSDYPPQFPLEWGGHGAMPKPAGSPAAFPLAVSRHCADVPACQHPPPHPGSQSMRPHNTRSMAAFATSYTNQAYSPSPPPMNSATFHQPRSPTGSPPRRPPASLVNTSSRESDEDQTFLTSGVKAESGYSQDPMIKRLGHFMALLGPRYKTISKEMLWEKAERGERTPAQRRLHKLGGIEAVGGGPDRLRPSGSAPDGLGPGGDSDGKARSAWLAARTAEREKRNRAARSASATR